MFGFVVVYAKFRNALSLYGDGQNNVNTRHYRNKTVCLVELKEDYL